MNAKFTFTPEDMQALRGIDHGKAIRDIAGHAAAQAGMTAARVLGPDRCSAVVRVRDIICYAANRQGYNFEQIAGVLQRDPTNISAAVRRERARRGEA